MPDGSRPRPPARVPPNNLRAEESVLGAMLLSRDAIAEVVEIIEPDHFYKPAHGHVFDAMLSLYSGGEPVDAVTVADELKRAGLLDEVGGHPVLLDLQATTPAISNAAHYAKIVEEHALLRRMIGVSNEIAESAYSIPEDVEQAVDDAESKMFAVAERRVQNTMAPIADLLPANLDRIEMLYDRGEAITGLSSGYLDLDEKLAGLQPNALYVVGARPAMGKCLTGDTRILDPKTGALVRIDELVHTRGFDGQAMVMALDESTSRLVPANPSAFAPNGIRSTYRLTTCLGRQITATANHPFRTPRGWTDLGDLGVGELIASPRRLDVFGVDRLCNAELEQLIVRVMSGEESALPAATFRLPEDQLALVVSKLFEVWADRGRFEVSADAERFARDVQHVLLRFGIVAQLRATRRGWAIDFAAPAEDDCDVLWDEIVEIAPAGEQQTYDIEVPGYHNFVANDLVTHNTAFALGLAANSAMKDQRPVLFFTLEMAQLELSQRLLCSEALVDAGRVKTGRLEEGEWARITHAVGRLAEAPIFIDDNPHTSIMDIRAKARRLKSRQGDLGLVVIDYIQLMTGRMSAENRQVEVSEISRNLKILARELEAPVVALAQLNRSLEQRENKRPMLSDLRESGCMPASARLTMADGSQRTLGDLLLTQDTPLVWAVDDRNQVVARRLVRTFPSGKKQVYRMTLASGRSIEATGCHRFLTIDGWRRLEELELGGFVATPRVLPEPSDPDSWPDDEVVLLAHLLGDGSVVNAVKYSSIDEANLEAVRKAVRHFGCEARHEGAGTAKRTGAVQLWVPAPYHLTHGRHHPIRDWLEPLGVWGKRSHEKTIPEEVHRLSARQVALFLRHLWATDGSITLGRNQRGPFVRCYYSTTSQPLADGVQRLLQRFEIRSVVTVASKSGYRDSYHVRIQGQPDLLRFLTQIGCHGHRGDVIAEAIKHLQTIKPNPNVDLVPWPVADKVRAALAENSVTQRQLAAGLGEHYCGSYLLGSPSRPRRFSRNRLRRIGEILGDAELVDIATSDLYWDEIVSIESRGEQAVFDATVEDAHNFIANGVVAHNSLEQDADVVLFLYRDEVYNEDSADKGVAEVLIAKHRNGPTGKTRLAFRGQYTRFDNMARRAAGSSAPPPPGDDVDF